MNLEQAKFTLQSFRSDGSDSRDPSFAEALALAAEHRELGEWLARERAADAAFAEALHQIEIPETLREEILAGINGGVTDIPVTEMDGEFIGALALLSPPAGLKDSILAAMHAETPPENVVEMTPAPRSNATPWWTMIGAAAAVIIAAALSLNKPAQTTVADSFTHTTPSPQATAIPVSYTVREARDAGVNYFLTSFEKSTLDVMSANHADIYKFLADHPALKPAAIPNGLADQPSIGCKLLDLDGHPASLICFMTSDAGVVHLVTFERSSISGDLPNMAAAADNSHLTGKGNIATTAWETDEHASFLFAPGAHPEQLSSVF